MAVAQSTAVQSTKPHIHILGDQCPYCEQPIPNDRAEEVHKKIQAKLRQQQADADAKAKAEIDAFRTSTQASIDALKADAAKRETAALETGRKRGEEALQGKLAAAAAAEKAAKDRGAVLESELAQSRAAHVSAVEKMNSDFAQKEAAARLEARTAAVQELGGKLTEAHNARLAAERQTTEIRATLDETVNGRVAEVREALEKQKQEEFNKLQAKGVQETQKLQDKVAELQRELDKRSSNELGEGAEIDLLDALKAEFPDDDIRKVGKGKPGADIIHKVKHNGAVCGTIVYDSKNHKQWRQDHVTKLRQDQIAEKAEHAVLSTLKFPRDKKHLDMDGGVILLYPARAAVVAMILRKHLIQMHALKVSNEERSRKTDELYAYMTSERFELFISGIKKTADQLEALQAQEKRSHENHWKKEGEYFRTIIRNCAQFDEEIARIIGTAT